MEDIRQFIDQQLYELLKDVTVGFKKNELAFLSLQGKNELQIRDKIAWRLHQSVQKKFHGQYMVRREWSAEGDKARVDLAVLELSKDRKSVEKVIALVELKAHSLVKQEKWYIEAFNNDMRKMKHLADDIEICKGADLYYIFLQSMQERYEGKYMPAFASSNYNHKNAILYDRTNSQEIMDWMNAEWHKMVKVENDDDSSPTNEVNILIYEPRFVGRVFECDYAVAPSRFGPVQSEWIQVSD